MFVCFCSMSGAQSVRAGKTKSPATSGTIEVCLPMHYIIASMMLDIHKHYVLLLFYLVTEEFKALQSHSKAVTQPKGYVCLTLACSSHLRKTPVHKLYSSGLGRHLQSDGPTKGPPVLSQLPLGFHQLYTHIEYECASPFYQHSGSSRRTCLMTGKWSGRHVSCSPGEGSRGPPVV